MWKRLSSFLPRFWSNWITLLGSVITTVAGCTMLMALAASLATAQTKPYTAAVVLLIMPGIFVLGLVVVAAGFWYERHRKERHVEEDPIQKAFTAALRDKRSRRLIVFFSIATLVNIFLLGVAGHNALEYMDSPRFCGAQCHTVMQPEYDTYRESPHSKVKCVECHIGPGASWAVKSKIDGLRQVWAMATGTYSRPVPSPVHDLRPAQDTCEQCHWPAKFHGNRVQFFTHYADDEENSAATTALLLKIGGRDPASGEYHGIHWHVSRDIEIRYEAHDEKREVIGKVQVYKDGELAAEYNKEGVEGAVTQTRTMDCIDCHNRPTHIFDPNPKLAVDRAFFDRTLDTDVPYLHEMAVKVLTDAGTSVDRDTAEATFAAQLKEAYAAEHPDADVSDEQIAQSAKGLASLYLLNVYPHLELTWGTHPNHLGHLGGEQDLRGCFRCHDDEHENSQGETISMDCELCHSFLVEEEPPADLPDNLRGLFPRNGEEE